MTLAEIQARLTKLKEKGFVTSLRRGSTGIGYTLEKRLGLNESNIPIPDLGGRVELKATRSHSSSLITLFTFNRGVWRIPQGTVIQNYGYTDESGRRALYSTVRPSTQNQQKLSIHVDVKNHRIDLLHDERTVIASWDIYILVSKLLGKLGRVLFVSADSRIGDNNVEEFHFNNAFLLKESSARAFINAFKNAKIALDIRMHLKPNGSVRNHGTGIRINLTDMPSLYEDVTKLI